MFAPAHIVVVADIAVNRNGVGVQPLAPPVQIEAGDVGIAPARRFYTRQAVRRSPLDTSMRFVSFPPSPSLFLLYLVLRDTLP